MQYRSLNLPIFLPSEEEALHCIARVEDALRRLSGVQDASVNNAHDTLRVLFDPRRVSTSRIEQETRRSGMDISLRIDHVTVALPTLDSPEVAAFLTRTLFDTAGILWTGANFPAAILHIEFDKSVIDFETIRKLLTRCGYSPVELWRSDKELPVLTSFAAPSPPLSGHLRRIVSSVFRRLPILLLFIGTFALHWWGTAATLALLFTVTDVLRNALLSKTRRQIWTFLSNLPVSVVVRREDNESEVPVSEVRIGEQIVVAADTVIPLDGVVTHGTATVDAEALFGADSGYDAEAGSPVFAGSQNTNGTLEIRVLRHFRDTPLVFARHAFAETITQQSPAQNRRERWHAIGTATCLWLAVLIAFVPPFLLRDMSQSSFAIWVMRGLSLAAFALGGSLTLSGTTRRLTATFEAARHGIVVRSGAALEAMGRIKSLAHARTGILTEGRPAVVDVVSSGKLSGAELLGLAAALEAYSTHPLARAICHEASQHSITESHSVTVFEEIPGQGVRGIVNDTLLMIGSPRLFAEQRYTLPRPLQESLSEADAQGLTPVLIAGQTGLLGLIALRDTPRPSAAKTVQQLRESGVFMQMVLSGDTARAVEAVAQAATIAEFESERIPEEKAAWVENLRRQYGAVAFIGDGTADRNAFSAADVSLTLRAAENPAGMEAADIAILNAETESLVFLRRLARQIHRIETQSLLIALTLKVLALVGVWAFHLPLWSLLIAELCATLIALRAGLPSQEKQQMQTEPKPAKQSQAAESPGESDALLELVFVHDPTADEEPVPGYSYPRWEAFVVPFVGETIQFGRKSNQSTLALQVTDEGMSRLHGEIRLENRRPVIVDLRSTNGIRRNGHAAEDLIPTEKPIPLRFGDVLMIGRNTRIEVRPPGESAQVLKAMQQSESAFIEKSGTIVR